MKVLTDWRERLFGITQAEALDRMKTAMEGMAPPTATRDQHGKPREGWDKPDGREVLHRLSLVQARADRILGRKRA